MLSSFGKSCACGKGQPRQPAKIGRASAFEQVERPGSGLHKRGYASRHCQGMKTESGSQAYGSGKAGFGAKKRGLSKHKDVVRPWSQRQQKGGAKKSCGYFKSWHKLDSDAEK